MHIYVYETESLLRTDFQMNPFTELDLIVFPQFWNSGGGHWFCIAIDIRIKTIVVYDSLYEDRRARAMYRVSSLLVLR